MEERLVEVPFGTLEGLTLKRVERKTSNWNDDVIEFETDTGRLFRMHHQQVCCELVSIDDICGDLTDLVGTPIRDAYESSNSSDPPPEGEDDRDYTWTFYTVRSLMGTVSLRWYGRSTGYYSERVDFDEVLPPTEEDLAEEARREAIRAAWRRNEEKRKADHIAASQAAARTARGHAERYRQRADDALKAGNIGAGKAYRRLADNAEQRAKNHELIFEDQAAYSGEGGLLRWVLDDFRAS